MKDYFDNLNNRLDEVQSVLADIRVDLARNTRSLEEHMRRTEALESAVDVIRAEARPVQTHVAVVGALGKVLAAGGTVVAIVEGVLQLTGHK